MLLLMQIKLHGQTLESLYKDVPMRLLPVEYLPDDYKGPNAGTEKELIGSDLLITCRHVVHVSHCRTYRRYVIIFYGLLHSNAHFAFH